MEIHVRVRCWWGLERSRPWTAMDVSVGTEGVVTYLYSIIASCFHLKGTYFINFKLYKYRAHNSVFPLALQWFLSATWWRQKCTVPEIIWALDPDSVESRWRLLLWITMEFMILSVRMMVASRQSSATAQKPAGVSTVQVSADPTRGTKTSSVIQWRQSEFVFFFCFFLFFPAYCGVH